MYAEISSALTALKTVSDLAKAAGSLANYGETLAAVNVVQEKLSGALVANMASAEKQALQSDRIRDLEGKIVQFENWDVKCKDYYLQAVGAYKRHFVQVYKPAQQTTQPRHWACAKCFQESKIYILSESERGHSYRCPSCKTETSPIVPGGTLAPIDSAYE